MTTTIETKEFKSFFSSCQKMILEYYTKNFPSCNETTLEISSGRRYIKITKGSGVWAFVDKTNGDVLKPASWSAPAKHARGNIFDEYNGIANVGPYGPAYL